MQRQASETMKPPAASRRVEPTTAGKAAARPAGAQGKDVGGVRPPLRGGGPYQRMRAKGALGSMNALDLPTVPAPAARW